MKTAALAAFIQSRNMRFAGAPVTLRKLLQMWQLPHDGVSETIDGAVLEGVARYCKLSVDELTVGVEALLPPAPPPAPLPVIIESSKPLRPDPTAVIPQEQLTDLVAASRKSEPVIETPAPLAGPEDDHEVEISFDEVEATPVPEAPAAPEAPSETKPEAKPADAKSGKSKKSRKKKS